MNIHSGYTLYIIICGQNDNVVTIKEYMTFVEWEYCSLYSLFIIIVVSHLRCINLKLNTRFYFELEVVLSIVYILPIKYANGAKVK